MTGDVHLIRGAVEALDRHDPRRWAPACGSCFGRTTSDAAEVTCDRCRASPPPAATGDNEGVEHVSDPSLPSPRRREGAGRHVGAEGQAAGATAPAPGPGPEADDSHPRDSAAASPTARKVGPSAPVLILAARKGRP